MILPGFLESSSVTFSGITLGPTRTYESNVLFALRYMVDCEVVGGSWVEAPKGKYQLAQPGFFKSTCQIEISLDYQDLINHPPEGKHDIFLWKVSLASTCIGSAFSAIVSF